jgi:chromosome partitioning protein
VPHHLGVVAVGQMLRAVYQSAKTLQRDIVDISILPVMYNPHINEHKESITKVEKSFGKDKLLSPIGVDIKLAQQFESGSPIVLNTKRSKGMKDYTKCVDELIKRF